MTQQRTQAPAALIHAAWLEKSLTIGAPEAASELRRLHEVEKQRDELLAALEGLVNALDSCIELTPERICAAVAAIASVKGTQ